jgi:hypothetical protein
MSLAGHDDDTTVRQCGLQPRLAGGSERARALAALEKQRRHMKRSEAIRIEDVFPGDPRLMGNRAGRGDLRRPPPQRAQQLAVRHLYDASRQPRARAASPEPRAAGRGEPLTS